MYCESIKHKKTMIVNSGQNRERAPRAALSATRALNVLNLFVTHPADRFSLSEIGRHCQINPASIHALLAILTSGGFILKDQKMRTYGIGPALIPIGEISRQQSPAIKTALEYSGPRSAEIVISVHTTTSMIIIGTAGSASPYGSVLYSGQVLPLNPPFGALFLAWETPEAMDDWLRSAQPPLSPAECQHQISVIDSVRTRGYAVAYKSTARPTHGASINHQSGTSVSHHRLIAAPIFNDYCRVAASISVHGIKPTLTKLEVTAIAEKLRGAALAITKKSGGRTPLGLSTGIEMS